jgi:GAF domain-containing protein
LEIQSQTENDFPIETLNLLNTLADQVAMGLHNAQQYAAEQKRRRLAEILELTGRVLVGSLNLAELPGRALSALKALLPHDRSSLWMQKGVAPSLAQYG